MVSSKTQTRKNWAGTRKYENVNVYYPRDEEEVKKSIKSSLDRGRRLKPMGEGLSFSDAFAPNQHGDLISLSNLSSIKINRDRKTTTVGSGRKLMDMHQPLYENDLSLDNFGSIVMQAAAGYTGTGSHGTGLGTKILSAQIEDMTLFDGSGDMYFLSRDNHPELFSAARVGLGALGVVTQMTFNCVDAFDLEEKLEIVDFDKAVADIAHYTNPERNLYCKYWWLPYTDKMLVYGFNKTDKPHTRPTVQEYLDSSGVSGKAFSGFIKLTDAIPGMSKFVHNFILKSSFKPHTRRDRSDKIIKYVGEIPIHDEAEYAVDMKDAQKAITEMRRIVENAPYHVNFMAEVRFCAADDIPMSPTYGRPSCYVGAYTGLKTAEPYIREFENMISAYDGRPHWGKQFNYTSEDFRRMYPKFDEFNELRKKHDPNGLFKNSFTDRIFGE